jgi:predicted PurR-regulated permease PerM
MRRHAVHDAVHVPVSAKPQQFMTRIERHAQTLLVLFLFTGCGLVLLPFLPAILFSAAIAISTWPIHRWTLRHMSGWPNTASLLSCLVVTLMVVIPAIMLILSLRDGASWLEQLLKQLHAGGQSELPEWIVQLPLIGEPLQNAWRELSSSSTGFNQMLAGLAEPARRVALASGLALVNGLLQVSVSALLLFFLYRDGALLAQRIRSVAVLLGGSGASQLLARAQQSITGVMISVVGAALAQASVATFGFYIAGIPNPMLLGALTFALSIVPVGPPLIWSGAALWLFEQSQTGWAVFMVIYGIFVISTIDNLLKPLLISRYSSLPFVLTLIGVIGGVVAFGVTGVILGPVALALALELLTHRLESTEPILQPETSAS